MNIEHAHMNIEENILKAAAAAMNTAPEEAIKNCREISELNAYYFWQPVRGGLALIIAASGEKLRASSAISFEQHLKAFKEGKRN